MKSIERRQKAAITWTAFSLILALGATGGATRALGQTSPDGTPGGAIGTRLEVPFKLYRDYAIVARGSVGQRDNLNFLVDTGFSSTAIDKSLARKLRLATSPRVISVFGTTITTEEVIVPSLHLGPLEVERLPVVVQDLSPLEEALSVRIDAIVGIDVLSRSSLTVEYEGRKLIWGAAEPLLNTVSCDPRFPYPTVPLQIGNRTLRVYVDTGAKELALFENQTGVISGTRVVGQENRTTIKGQVIVKAVELPELTLAKTHWVRREGYLMEGSLFDGTLGPKWLGAKRIRFDFEHKVVSWEESPR